jgi:transcriptional regulator with XRE-family HTH domain
MGCKNTPSLTYKVGHIFMSELKGGIFVNWTSEKLKRVMDEFNLTQSQVAEMCGLRQEYVSRLLSGHKPFSVRMGVRFDNMFDDLTDITKFKIRMSSLKEELQRKGEEE